jgi:hypothetical protein
MDGHIAREVVTRYRKRIIEGTLTFMPRSEYTRGKVGALAVIADMLSGDGPYLDGKLAALFEVVELIRYSQETEGERDDVCLF